jgi:hypothetical protein
MENKLSRKMLLKCFNFSPNNGFRAVLFCDGNYITVYRDVSSSIDTEIT